MTSNLTKHSLARCKQRSIPPLVLHLLDEFGERQYDSHGGVKVYFTHRSVRTMQRELGRRPVAKLREYLNSYFIETTDGSRILTAGHRTKRVRRK